MCLFLIRIRIRTKIDLLLQGPDWEFQTKLPDWADENWVPPN